MASPARPPVFGSLIWRPNNYQRNATAYLAARSWRADAKKADIARLKAAKAAIAPAVLADAADDLVEVIRTHFGSLAGWSITCIPCGHSRRADCFGKQLAQRIAEQAGVPFVQVWDDRFCSGVSHPKEFQKLPPLDWIVEPPRVPVLVVDDVATSGWHMEEALLSLREVGVVAQGLVWIGGTVVGGDDRFSPAAAGGGGRRPGAPGGGTPRGVGTRPCDDPSDGGQNPVDPVDGLVSGAAFGRMHGVSKEAVRKWKVAGFLVMQGDLVDVAASDDRLRRAAKGRFSRSDTVNPASTVVDPPVDAGSTGDDGDGSGAVDFDTLDAFLAALMEGRFTTLAQADEIKANALAGQRVLELRKAAGRLIDFATAETVLFESARAFRDKVMNWPGTVGPLLAADLDLPADRVTEALIGHVHKLLDQLGQPDNAGLRAEG